MLPENHDTVILDFRHDSIGTLLTVRVRGGRPAALILTTCLATFAATAYSWAWPCGSPATPGPCNSLGADVVPAGSDWASRGGGGGGGGGNANVARLVIVVATAVAVVAAWELLQVASESVLVLPGGVGYVLESVRRCGLRRRRFLDAQEVSYVTLSEAITSCDVRFFLAFVTRDVNNDSSFMNCSRNGNTDANAGGNGSSSSCSRLAVPYENLLPRLQLRHLQAIYRELELLQMQHALGPSAFGSYG
ncbi:hypothetical protein VOLCADRAFT_106594 [Volvox carteri f. nagariensis]|uniref:Phosphatidylinositol N-acetylglucosaminyltransferase subunit H conserved domain-containing protein n=1 Tax=Volvox carteri f. nagariensis TaxID=3068 RepID=D8U8F3_VOLCA|nr:uncharacterized protein VOLCADRAFT_106594 [Volvox carteri f. nagariensis]EFJ43968.1 hypothetical protein VOLCADRAFT_106594 [Volvox carteri f. nagariensis]|eukprot:XP_002954980.1 hypothetical protein VOLCADRAFT_106594 [Volvox carteri f. nagariensis]